MIIVVAAVLLMMNAAAVVVVVDGLMIRGNIGRWWEWWVVLRWGNEEDVVEVQHDG